MDKRYDIHYRGELLEGFAPQTVRNNLAKLFGADEATLARLFSGKAQLVKQDCDKSTALKYKQAMEKAGAKPLLSQAGGQAAKPSPPASQETTQGQHQPTAAERIAALAAADENHFTASSAPPSSEQEPADTAGAISLAPEGTAVLREEERTIAETREVDVSGISLAASGEDLSKPAAAPPPPPDTSHISVAEVGATIPTLEDNTPLLNPNTSHIDLCPEGTDFSDCQREIEPVDVNTDGLSLDEPGKRLQEEKKETTTAPDTSHIQLDSD